MGLPCDHESLSGTNGDVYEQFLLSLDPVDADLLRMKASELNIDAHELLSRIVGNAINDFVQQCVDGDL